MDTDSTYPQILTEPISSTAVITLDILQYFFYCTEQIDVFAPDGMRLETIGYGVKEDALEINSYRLKEQMYVLECLLSNLHNRIELPAKAVVGLADLLGRMQGFCREYIK